jgi:hypothetical protein
MGRAHEVHVRVAPDGADLRGAVYRHQVDDRAFRRGGAMRSTERERNDRQSDTASLHCESFPVATFTT